MISPGHRRRLNRAMHELRRPLQSLVLLDEPPRDADRPANGAESARRGLLELARSALASLDGEVNGASPLPARREVSCRELVDAALERWRPLAAAAGGVRLYWDAGAAPAVCDPVRVAQALDNLLANAVEHGGAPIVVTGARVADRLRVTVANGPGGGAPGAGSGSDGARRNEGRDPRRGHGVELVTEVAGEHRGRFALCRTGSGCVAALEVPLTPGGLAQAA